ncbi:MAG TPA: hypothetical protein VKU80_05570, partial [Planctomycetota bacterium]|nr:hypothetical protein [Planctomycetota bacterium]
MNTLFALVLLFQQESAETAFKKIEAGIERANNIRVLFTVTPASLPGNLRRGTMTVEGEAKARLSADLRIENGTRISVWTEFENARIRSSVADHLVELKAEGRLVRQNFDVYLSRLGIFAGALFEHGFWSGSSRGPLNASDDLKQMFPLTDFAAAGDGSNGSKILKYSFSPVLKPMPFTWAKI